MSSRKKRGLLVFVITCAVLICCILPGVFSTINRSKTPTPLARQRTRVAAPTRTPRLPASTPAVVLTLMDALTRKKIAVEVEGAGLSAVRIEAERLEPVSLKVVIPVGTFFVNRGSAQDMVSMRETTLHLMEEEPVKVSVPAACANLLRAVPGASSSFDIIASPEQEELIELVAAVDKGKHTSVVKQVAVWIVTDDVSRPKLDSRYVRRSSYMVFGGTPAASDEDVIKAMWLVSEAGIPLADKKIFTEGVSLVRALVSTDPAAGRYAREALGVAQEDVVPYLGTCLEEDSPEIRRAGAYALGKLGDQQAVEPLTQALYDDQEEVGREAVKSLGELKAVEALVGALSHPDAQIRSSAVRALSDLKDPRAVGPIIEVLGDEESIVRQVATYALRHLGNARAVEPLIECLDDSSEFVRAGAAEALGEIGDTRAIEPLKALLATEQDKDVIDRTERALGRLER